jgi:hypothetical protein
LDLLGFVRPNRDFSMGCGGKNKKKLSSFFAPPRLSKGAGCTWRSDKRIAYISDFRKQLRNFPFLLPALAIPFWRVRLQGGERRRLAGRGPGKVAKHRPQGRMAEWFKAAVLKTAVGASPP